MQTCPNSSSIEELCHSLVVRADTVVLFHRPQIPRPRPGSILHWSETKRKRWTGIHSTNLENKKGWTTQHRETSSRLSNWNASVEGRRKVSSGLVGASAILLSRKRRPACKYKPYPTVVREDVFRPRKATIFTWPSKAWSCAGFWLRDNAASCKLTQSYWYPSRGVHFKVAKSHSSQGYDVKFIEETIIAGTSTDTKIFTQQI